jgi:hypothetical protein
VSSVAEAEFGALFINAKKALPGAYQWLKWITTTMPKNSKLKAPHKMVLSIIQSSKYAQNQWT